MAAKDNFNAVLTPTLQYYDLCRCLDCNTDKAVGGIISFSTVNDASLRCKVPADTRSF